MKKKAICLILAIILTASLVPGANASRNMECAIGESISADGSHLGTTINPLSGGVSGALYTFGVSGSFDYDEANEVLRLVNELRAGLSLSALVMDEALLEAGMQRAVETAIFWDHQRPDGTSPFTAFPPGSSSRSENIAVGQNSASAVMHSWTNSAGHYTNMTSSGYTAIGIGCFYQGGEKYWVQLFSGGTTPTPSTATGVQEATKTVTALGENLVLDVSPDSATITVNSSHAFTLHSMYNAGWYGARNKTIIPSFYESANMSIATVDANGMVFGVSPGQTTIKLGVGNDFYKEAIVTIESPETPEPSDPPDPQDPQDPPEPPDTPPSITPLPTATVTASAASEAIRENAEAAVKAKVFAAQALSISVEQVGPTMTVNTGAGVPTVVTIQLLSGTDTEIITTMVMLNDDGTLSPVPTKINPNGTISVIISGDVTLVPLFIEADFNDVAGHWGAPEIARAASLMIIEGVGGGAFDPSASVTNAEAVTMFLRAFGVAPDGSALALSGIDQTRWYAVNMNTAAQRGWISSGIAPEIPMTRIETAGLIVNALKSLGMSPKIPSDDINATLSQFSDLEGLTESQREHLAICVGLNIFVGNGDGTMGPWGQLTRTNMATLAVRLQELILNSSTS